MVENTHPFIDFPIEFKKIAPEDFPHFIVDDLTIISPDENGYIKNSVKSVVNIDIKNTVVINAGVGQGKTTAVIDILYDTYLNTSHLIFIASPFVSLVEQYYRDVLEKGIPEEDVFRYEVLGNETLPEFCNKRVHIITANCLLGNPGEDSFINSDVKRLYLNRLSKHCETTNIKVVFIYDEIHDAVHNFKEKYIFNLWKWRNVIQKNLIISATFNEASKVVIEYLSELTDNKIQIIESERVRFPLKQSQLFLHYNDERFYNFEDEIITDLVKELIVNGKEVDILSYSKSLADAIIINSTSGIGKELYNKYEKINNCTSELILNQRKTREIPQNRYNPDMCNVGTNFKTGVSIKKDNHALVIIMPPKGASMPFKNNYGIFSSGINSIIQAIARQRTKGEIHIILPKPKEFDYSTLPFEEVEEVDYFTNFYDKVKDSAPVKKTTKYLPLQIQNQILLDFYENELKQNIREEIEYIKSLARETKVRLTFPEFKLYKLVEGENYLTEKTQFFGKDLSAYITYCAITNQFLNCNFKGGISKQELILNYGEIQKGLTKYCSEVYFKDDSRAEFYHIINDPLFYNQFRNDLFEMCSVRLLTTEGDLVNLLKDGTSKASKYFEEQLMGFIQNFGHPNNPVNAKFFDNDTPKDATYTRSQYYLDGISHAQYLNAENFESLLTKQRINAFKFLGELRISIENSIRTHQLGSGIEIRYLLNSPEPNFINSDNISKFNGLIEHLLDENNVFNKRFSIKSRIEGKSASNKIKTFYRILLEDLFTTEDYKLPTGTRPTVKKLIFIKNIQDYNNVVNYVIPQDYTFPEGYEPPILSEDQLKQIKEYTGTST